jgi:hypothetical protein
LGFKAVLDLIFSGLDYLLDVHEHGVADEPGTDDILSTHVLASATTVSALRKKI